MHTNYLGAPDRFENWKIDWYVGANRDDKHIGVFQFAQSSFVVSLNPHHLTFLTFSHMRGHPVFDAAASLIQLMPADMLNDLTEEDSQPPQTSALHMFVAYLIDVCLFLSTRSQPRIARRAKITSK